MHWAATRPRRAPPGATPTWQSLTARRHCSPKFVNTLVELRRRTSMHDPPRILIVDDHETNRDILATRLATQGYDLCQASDGQEALDAAKALLPDLILLDVMMPKLNGIEVCRGRKAVLRSTGSQC